MQKRPDPRPLEPIAGGAEDGPPDEIDERRLGAGTGDTADSDATGEEVPSEADQPATGDPTGTGRPVLDDHHVERDQHDVERDEADRPDRTHEGSPTDAYDE